jgi:hypothetical protein
VILIDFSQVFISNLHVQLGKHLNAELDTNLIRHMVLNSLRMYNQKFSKEYGELVICCDEKKSWRKAVFPYYKAHRRKAREESEIDWASVFHALNLVRDEIEENFPYRVIHIEGAEADDIIGTLVEQKGVYLNNSTTEQILILSADKDFLQLHKYVNVKQYDPIRKRWLVHNNPEEYLFEHIFRGDPGDGIPNILSNDDTFVSNSRQKPVTMKRIQELREAVEKDNMSTLIQRNYMRNRQLVDLTYTPSDIKEKTIDKYNNEAGKDRNKLFNYFIKYKLKNLTEVVNEF